MSLNKLKFYQQYKTNILSLSITLQVPKIFSMNPEVLGYYFHVHSTISPNINAINSLSKTLNHFQSLMQVSTGKMGHRELQFICKYCLFSTKYNIYIHIL